MNELSVRQMRAAIGRLDKLVAESGELIITRHGRPIARVLPITDSVTRPDHAELRKQTALLETSSATLIRQEREAR